MKNVRFFLLITFMATSCLKSENEKPVIWEPWPTYDYATYWKATGIRDETQNWQSIADSIYFGFGSNDPFNADLRTGVYFYDYADSIVTPILPIKDHGHFLQKDSLITFKYQDDEKERAVKYKIYGDSILLIKDTTVIPEMQFKYKRVELAP